MTGIGGNAFLNAKVEKVTLTSQVTEIGAYAFEKCKSLKAVDVEGANNLVTVGNYAFSECTNLTGFDFGENLTEIGECAFYYCSGLSGNLILPEGLTAYWKQCFSGVQESYRGTETAGKPGRNRSRCIFRMQWIYRRPYDTITNHGDP